MKSLKKCTYISHFTDEELRLVETSLGSLWSKREPRRIEETSGWILGGHRVSQDLLIPGIGSHVSVQEIKKTLTTQSDLPCSCRFNAQTGCETSGWWLSLGACSAGQRRQARAVWLSLERTSCLTNTLPVKALTGVPSTDCELWSLKRHRWLNWGARVVYNISWLLFWPNNQPGSMSGRGECVRDWGAPISQEAVWNW